MQYIINNGGIDTEEDYPYVALDAKCARQKQGRYGSALPFSYRLDGSTPRARAALTFHASTFAGGWSRWTRGSRCRPATRRR